MLCRRTCTQDLSLKSGYLRIPQRHTHAKSCHLASHLRSTQCELRFFDWSKRIYLYIKRTHFSLHRNTSYFLFCYKNNSCSCWYTNCIWSKLFCHIIKVCVIFVFTICVYFYFPLHTIRKRWKLQCKWFPV